MPREPGFLRFFDARVGRVIRDHHLIQAGDHVLVASICVRDGLPLLALLHHLRHPGAPSFHLSFGVLRPTGMVAPAGWRDALARVAADAGAAVHELPGYEPALPECAACRAGALAALARLAVDTGCSVVALPDTLDTLAEDVLVGLVAAGELRRTDLSVQLAEGPRLVRPLSAVETRHLRRYARERGLPDADAACPFDDPARRLHLAPVLAVLGGKPARLKFNLVRSARQRGVVSDPRTL